MSIFIKPGYWNDSRKSIKGALNLDNFVGAKAKGETVLNVPYYLQANATNWMANDDLQHTGLFTQNTSIDAQDGVVSMANNVNFNFRGYKPLHIVEKDAQFIEFTFQAGEQYPTEFSFELIRVSGFIPGNGNFDEAESIILYPRAQMQAEVDTSSTGTGRLTKSITNGVTVKKGDTLYMFTQVPNLSPSGFIQFKFKNL